MKVKRIGSRGTLFTLNVASEWDLNIYLIKGSRYNFIIDTGLGSLSMAAVKEYLKNDGKPVIIINTHYHWDHIWGNCYFRESTIISHRLCRDLIEDMWQQMLEKNGRYIHGETEMVLPNMVFEEELYFPEDKVRVLYTPGHTTDSISVLDEEDRVIHAGDNIGDTVEDIIPAIYGERMSYTSTLARYMEMSFDSCVSGHNVVLGKNVFEIIRSKFL